VDGVRFHVYASDNSTLLDEWIIPASYRFLDHGTGMN